MNTPACPPRAGCPRFLGPMLLLATAGATAATTATAPAARFPLDAGAYTVRSTLVMPHLEEMRRIVDEARHCVGVGEIERLFPVLRQPALRGCRLGHGTTRHAEFVYLLVCESARVASGTATVRHEGDRVIGTLEVKMGGKNMTFAQRVEARRQGRCADGE